jgi:hypothetical protein
MAAWFTVYCSRSVAHVTATEILTEIDRWDFYTTAEGFGIDDDEAVKRALDSLKFETVDGLGAVRFRLTFGPPGRRPILIHAHSDPEVIAEEMDEADELLDQACGEGVDQIRAHLAHVVEVVMVELGWSQLENMGVVFAGMVSEHLAIAGAGLIRDPYDVWWAMKDHVPIQLAGPQ